jgi:hypothetical protein
MAWSDHDQHISIDDLSTYLDGEIESAEERARIEQHLATCETCREELESLRAVSQLLSELPEPALPRSFRLSPEDVEPAPEPGPASEPVPIQPWILRNQVLFRYAGLAAALLLVVLVTIDLVPVDDDEADDVFTTMQDTVEEAAPETDEPADAPDTELAPDDEPVDEPVTEEEAIEDEVEEDRDEVAPEEDPVADAPEEAAEPDLDEEEEDRPLVEPDTEDGEDLVDEPALDPVDDELLPRTTADAPDEGISTLRLLTIVVGALSAILLIAGFVLPRWWSASGSAR